MHNGLKAADGGLFHWLRPLPSHALNGGLRQVRKDDVHYLMKCAFTKPVVIFIRQLHHIPGVEAYGGKAAIRVPVNLRRTVGAYVFKAGNDGPIKKAKIITPTLNPLLEIFIVMLIALRAFFFIRHLHHLQC